MEYNVIENFLDTEYFDTINKTILAPRNFDWYFSSIVGHEEDNSSSTGYFTHTFFDSRTDNKNPTTSKFFELIFPLLDALDAKELIRAKVNLYPRTCQIEEHAPHQDFYFTHKGAILYLNTCNGFTRLNENKIFSVANRVLLFDGSTWHNSSTCTDSRFRMSLNVSYG